jgi:hypothetical protein
MPQSGHSNSPATDLTTRRNFIIYKTGVIIMADFVDLIIAIGASGGGAKPRAFANEVHTKIAELKGKPDGASELVTYFANMKPVGYTVSKDDCKNLIDNLDSLSLDNLKKIAGGPSGPTARDPDMGGGDY